MTAALVLVVFVSATELRAPATLALAHAAEEVLGVDSQVSVQGYFSPLDDTQLLAAAPRADAIAEVTWQDPERRRALVHCYIEQSHRVLNRELLFDETDDPRERGRMLGFSIASMLPETGLESPANALQKPAATATETTTAEPPPDASRSEKHTASPAPAVGAVDAVTIGSVGLGNPATSLGVGIAGRWFFYRGLSLRLSTGVRHGDIPSAQAVSEVFFGGLGIGFQFSSPDARSAFVFGGRTDALLESYTLRHRAADDSLTAQQTHAMPAADVLLEGAWYFWNSAALILAAGTEFSFGHADILVHGKEIADIPPLLGVGELGIRGRF